MAERDIFAARKCSLHADAVEQGKPVQVLRRDHKITRGAAAVRELLGEPADRLAVDADTVRVKAATGQWLDVALLLEFLTVAWGRRDGR